MNKKTSDTSDRGIVLTREFEAPPELVFDAWTEPEKIGRWWGPKGFSTTTREMSFEVGGEWIFTMHGPDGTDYPNHIIYTEIKEPERIKYEHYGHRDKKGDPPHFKSTIVFEDLGKRTRISCACFSQRPKNEMKLLSSVLSKEQTKP